MIIIPEDVLRIAEALSASIEELGLSARSYNGLRRWGITTVADVYRAYENKQLPRIRNLGEKSVIEIEKHLEEHLAKVAHVNTSETPNSSDTISRQAAIDALAKNMPSLTTPDGCGQFDHDIYVTDEAYVDCMQIIHDMPSAQPDIIRCRNCKFASGDSRICMKFGHSPIGELDFCTWAERRTDEE